MGLYALTDIGSTFSGDLKLDSRGDLLEATSYDSQVAATNFWLRTDHGDYAADMTVGCNLGEFIGTNNTSKNLDEMREQVEDSLVRHLFFEGDVSVQAIPFSIDEALVAVQVQGEFVNRSGQFEHFPAQVFAYIFPYIDATTIPVG